MPSANTLLDTLDVARRELLDVSTRNRLVNTSRTTSRSTRLEIVGESSLDVYEQLVTNGRSMTFEHDPNKKDKKEAAVEEQLLLQPEGAEEVEAVVGVTGDTVLQTSLSSGQLQKKLLSLYYDARTFEEEQGVSILYLALGYLKWFETETSETERCAPLLLIPVNLDRKSAGAKFRLSFRDDEITTNLSLQARLKTDFGINLPEVPDLEDLDVAAYFAAVREAIHTKSRWQILEDDIVLWFFSFSKFLMYRDLKPENWPKGLPLSDRPMLKSLLEDGFSDDPPIFDDQQSFDEVTRPQEMVHVVDADSSQGIVIEEVKRGRNLVIQGPPGTGKSQTIANLISGAVHAGKTVLFVAEKMAALDVVHSRLQNIGLGDMCLELHSSHANKRSVLMELSRTLQLPAPKKFDVASLSAELISCRDQLNSHLTAIHAPVQPSGLTPFQIIGELVRLRAQGTPLPDYQFADSLKWSKADFHGRLNLLREHARHIAETVPPKDHPWRGVTLDAVLPTDVQRLQSKLPNIIKRMERLLSAARGLATALRLPTVNDPTGISNLARVATKLAAAPAMDRQALLGAGWSERRERISELVATGTRMSENRAKLAGQVCDAGWDVDVGAARRDLAAYGRSWMRWFNGDYRRAQAQLAGILTGAPPSSLADRVAILDSLIAAQQATRLLSQDVWQKLGAEAFGKLWAGTSTNWAAVTAVADWEAQTCAANLGVDFRKILAGLDDVTALPQFVQSIVADLKPLMEELKELLQFVKLDAAAAFGETDLRKLSLVELSQRLTQWSEHPELLSSWVNYYCRAARLSRDGFKSIIQRLHQGAVTPVNAVGSAELAHYEVLIRETWRQRPTLASFDGQAHEKILAAFRELDRQRIEMARREVAQAHYQRIPRHNSTAGALGVVKTEIEKKRGHRPIRKLMTDAGAAVQAIKPVFLMSPLSIAQFLEPGSLEFDMLVIDEASQVQPVDALGGAARAKQIVVVGDSKQLPPSQFFSRMTSDDGDDRESEIEVNPSNLESILGLCKARGVSERMLRWHYRSRHHSLIAVSNREFYDDQLFVFPSPGRIDAELGLSFHFVDNGCFDRGGSSTNRIEARAVADAVMEHARNRPSQTLGVGCFSVAQRDAILDELELLRRHDPSVESFFFDSTEHFFVKNLENIQGDERDVIFISIGYARSAEGYMAMDFGPLSREGGERRLNVLISRARDCCRVFSSIRADDIDLNRAKGRGPYSLKTFLRYAESGLLDTGSTTGKEHDSEFERQVAVALQQQGYTIEPQVGVAGFFVDLAVVDPENPGRFVIGIECDGANYHRARSARDRDRLREAVLRSRGWEIHRIWSTDWFQRPQDELRKTVAAIEAARRSRDAEPAAVETRSTVIERELATAQEPAEVLTTQPYAVSSLRIPAGAKVLDLSRQKLLSLVMEVVETEGPVHQDEIARRIVDSCAQRMGSKIRETLDEAISSVSYSPDFTRDGEFVDKRNREIKLRDRTDIDVPSLKKVENLPPREIQKAVLEVVRSHLGVTADEITKEVALALGFKYAVAQLKDNVGAALATLSQAGKLRKQPDERFVGVAEPAAAR